ncbi:MULTISPECIES: alpha/beta fold hydrolase [unclassified Phaeobacter]|uniref:alpha/beta fold hydrolase n=1 Tax=unclassified Phaeobacter TaxID=2621772 RepID=UPI003A87D304
MGKTAEDSGDLRGLSDETVAAAVYGSVLGASNAVAWRDRLIRAGYDGVAGKAKSALIGSTPVGAGKAVASSWQGSAGSSDGLGLAAHLSPERELAGSALIGRHFDRAIYLRSRLIAAQNHGSWPELQAVLPCGARNWLLVSREAEILAAGDDWPSRGRITAPWIAQAIGVADAKLPLWHTLFDEDRPRPALTLLRGEGGRLLMCQAVGGRGERLGAVDGLSGARPSDMAAWRGRLRAVDPSAPAVLVEQLTTGWSDVAADQVALRFGFDPEEMSLLRHLLIEADWIELRIGTGAERGPELALLGQMLSKTAAPSCPEMLRFLAYLMQQTTRDHDIAAGRASPPQRVLSLASGLTSQYLQFGAERGQPVIFVHGIFDGVAAIQRLQPQLRARGLRCLAPLRCGYGGSDSLPSGTDPIDLFVTQLDALIDAEGLVNPILLGHRSGCLFAAAAGRRLRDRLGGVVCIGATLPLPSIGHARALRGHQRALALSAVHASAVLPLVVRSWSRSVRQKGPQVLVSRQIARESADRQLLADPALSAVLDQSHRMMMQQGRGGYEIDLRLAVRSRDMRHCAKAAPTIYLHGGEDTVTPVDKLQAALGSGHANLQIRVSKRAGTMLLYAQPELVFAAIDDLRQRMTS